MPRAQGAEKRRPANTQPETSDFCPASKIGATECDEGRGVLVQCESPGEGIVRYLGSHSGQTSPPRASSILDHGPGSDRWHSPLHLVVLPPAAALVVSVGSMGFAFRSLVVQSQALGLLARVLRHCVRPPGSRISSEAPGVAASKGDRPPIPGRRATSFHALDLGQHGGPRDLDHRVWTSLANQRRSPGGCWTAGNDGSDGMNWREPFTPYPAAVYNRPLHCRPSRALRKERRGCRVSVARDDKRCAKRHQLNDAIGHR